MKLPSTIVEHLQYSHPELLKAVRNDADQLLTAGNRLGFAPVVTESKSLRPLLEAKVRETVMTYAQKRRIPFAQAARAVDAERPAHLKDVIEGTKTLFNFLLNWHVAGRKIFYVVPALTDRLLNTSSEVPTELVRLPFPSLMFVYDDDAAFEAFHGAREIKRDPKLGAVSVVVCEAEADGERRLVFGAARSRGDRMSRQIYRSLLLREGWSTEQAIRTNWDEIHGPSGGSAEYEADEGVLLSRLILNTILYISSSAARVSQPRRNDASTRLDTKNFSPQEHQLVGEGITFITPGRSYERPDGPGVGGRTLSARHIVMGHWKAQTHGPKGSLRKTVWIEPYLRGPDMAAVIDRKYVVR